MVSVEENACFCSGKLLDSQLSSPQQLSQMHRDTISTVILFVILTVVERCKIEIFTLSGDRGYSFFVLTMRYIVFFMN